MPQQKLNTLLYGGGVARGLLTSSGINLCELKFNAKLNVLSVRL